MHYTVLLSFKSDSQSEVILFTDNVIQQTTSNPIFASLKPFVDPVEDAFSVFRVAFNLAKMGGALANIERDKKHIALLDVLTLLAKEVEKLAKGDKAIIIASGFKPSNEIKFITELTAPTNFVAINLAPKGVIQLNWDKVEGKLAYAIEMRIFGEDTWKAIAAPTGRFLTLTDLVRGSHLEFRIRATGTKNLVSPWSLIADVYVD